MGATKRLSSKNVINLYSLGFFTIILAYCVVPLAVEARAGGGGSGGGGGSSGGGSHGASGSWELVVLILCVLWLKKQPYGKMLSWIFLSIIFVGSWCLLPSIGWKMYASVVIFCAGFFGLTSKFPLKYSAHSNRETKNQLKIWKNTHHTWDETTLKVIAENVFKRFQNDWTAQDMRFFSEYLSERYVPQVMCMVQALQELNRRNVMEHVRVLSVRIIRASEDDGSPRFVAAIQAQAYDRLFEHEHVIFEDRSVFLELWSFVWEQGNWKLDAIGQSTRNDSRLQSSLSEFARLNNLYYSPDWGYLLMPRRGGLFSAASFGESDINNHCLGYYRGVLIQLYTYFPWKDNKTEYVVAQVTVPKTYGTIFMRPKRWWNIPQFRLKRILLEWNEFNQKYELYASDMERATSLELLHPAYMERVMAAGFPISIQVNDRTIYLAARVEKVQTAEAYKVLLDLTHEAFKELKM